MPKKKNNSALFSIFVAGSVLLVFVLFALYLSWGFLSYFSGNETAQVTAQDLASGEKVPYHDPLLEPAKTTYPEALSDDYWKGDTFASVTIFFYTSFDCSACAEQYETLKQIQSDYGEDKVRIVWKGTATEAEGLLAQQALYCAGQQDDFWSYLDRLYDREEFTRKFFTDLAVEQGMSEDNFDQCLDLALTEDKVLRNNQEAIDLEIKTLPYFYIDNTPYAGPLTVSELRIIIDSLL